MKRPTTQRLVKYWLPAFLWAAVIFALSSMKVHPTTEIYWQDFVVKKTAHLVEYSVLFTLLYRAFKNSIDLNLMQVVLFSFIILILYAISDEIHQSFTPGREPRVRDVLIDTTAGVIIWGVIWIYLPKAPRKLKNLAKNLEIV